MAVGAATLWRVRAGGNELNGGGYDSSISGAGTDYTDQDASQLSLTDLATSGAGSTTLTSATGGFTSAMVGNCVRIASGTNFQTGYYFITVYTDTNTVTVDRTPTSGGAGSGGTGRIGGAFASIKSLASGGGATPLITTPLVAGNTIWVRGAGTDDPSGTDYTETWAQFPAGNTTNGAITLRGYNGRPNFACSHGTWLYQLSCWRVRGIKCKATGSTDTTSGLISTSGLTVSVDGCIFDANGIDLRGVIAGHVTNCYFKNTGSTAVGTSTKAAITLGQYANLAFGNYIDSWRGAGIFSDSVMGQAIGNVVANCKVHGIYFIGAGSSGYRMAIVGNTVYKCTGANIYISNANGVNETLVMNNVCTEATQYNIEVPGTTAVNDRLASNWGYNFVYGAGTSNYRNLTAPSTDIALTGDPFTNAAAGDFSLDNTASQGAAVRAATATFATTLTVNYRDGGAVQHQDSGGGGGSVIVIEED